MTYRELGKKVLEQAEKPLSAEEIWEKACEMGLDKECNRGKILLHSFGSQLGEHDISNDEKQFYVARKEGKTFFYWLKSREREFPPQKTLDAKEEDDEQSECSGTAKKQKNSFHERVLHPLLVKFLDTDPNFKLLCKTIRYKKGKCEWNYPDIVGVYFPYNWNFYTIPVKKDTSFFPLSLKKSLVFPI